MSFWGFTLGCNECKERPEYRAFDDCKNRSTKRVLDAKDDMIRKAKTKLVEMATNIDFSDIDIDRDTFEVLEGGKAAKITFVKDGIKETLIVPYDEMDEINMVGKRVLADEDEIGHPLYIPILVEPHHIGAEKIEIVEE